MTSTELREQIGRETGISPAVLRGETEDEIRAHAAELAQLGFGAGERTVDEIVDQALGRTSDADDIVSQALGH